MMKAIVLTRYGSPDVLQIREAAKPAPKDNEVLVRVRAVSVNYGDLLARNFGSVRPKDMHMPWLLWLIAKLSFGFRAPKVSILGSEFAGDVEAVGQNVQAFRPGDAVFGYVGQRMGAYAEYVVTRETGELAKIPAGMTYEEAAAVPYGAIMAVNLMKKADLKPGQKVLINGASGAIGAAALQIAKHLGAEVTAVCGGPRLEYVKALGADAAIDYAKEDFTQSGQQYDLIFDVLGKSDFSRSQRALKPHGIHLYASFKSKQLLQMLATSRSGGKRVICALAPGSAEDLEEARALIEAGKIKAIIDRCYPMAQAAEAHRYMEAGQRKGSVIITMG